MARVAPPLRSALGALLLVHGIVGCGAKTPAVLELDAEAPPGPEPERCNGADDDLDDEVDEDFRNADGLYLDDDHCGACDRPCEPMGEAELEASCTLIEGAVRCAATRCRDGYVVGTTGRCVAVGERLCLGCGDDADCGSVPGARCASIGGESRCVVGCEAGCPEGYRCEDGLCLPEGGSCRCELGDSFSVACAVELPGAEPDGAPCIGRARCEDGVLSACGTSEDVCDEVDNDCDGVVDEDYVDARGAYALSLEHCGQCGVSCAEETGTELTLRCGGDPFAPSCVVECPDAQDGLQPGDMLDGDFDILNGCECELGSVEDGAGPATREGEQLDVNCDGADGVVVQSLYVASDGDDSGPGSPTRPLRTLGEAMERAQASRDQDVPRLDIYVAGGTYTETVRLVPGVRVHGGYRRDFRRLDRQAFETELRAAAGFSGAGVVLAADDIQGEPTLVEGLTLRGADADDRGVPAVAVTLVDVGPALTLRASRIFAGLPGEGRPGSDGLSGASAEREAEAGQPPREAVEDGAHLCVTSDPNNVVQGGTGGRNTCGDDSVFGGAGGAATCPAFAQQERRGAAGQDAAGGARGGAGGRGGQASMGPIDRVDADICPEPPCCEFSDFTVPTGFMGPQPGAPGEQGVAGGAGEGCRDPFGQFFLDGSSGWRDARGTAGTAGSAGAGGGGGGAGGGSEFEWFDAECEYADSLGGGGGGGGAGGCGGSGGAPGTSGAPSVAVLVMAPVGPGPTLEGLELHTAEGGRGGPGGAGGEGGAGGVGAPGGELPRSDFSTPPLAQAFAGGRGGRGGEGGSGGGGGGGCGGASVGIWVAGGSGRAEWETENRFQLGAGGEPGGGGGGGAPGESGEPGGRRDVHIQ